MKLKYTSGFSLIEIIIVVAIISILALIAIPTYQENISKSRRSDTQGALYSLASAMARFYTENNTFCGSDDGGNVGVCVNGGSPGIFSAQVPVDGGTAYYNLTISSVAANSYTLTATRTGVMSNDKCGNYTLTQANVQGISSQDTGVTASDCW